MSSIQSNDILSFFHNCPDFAFPGIKLPPGYRYEIVNSFSKQAQWIDFLCKSGEFIPTSPDYYYDVMVRFLLPAGAALVYSQNIIIGCNAVVDFRQVEGQANIMYFLVDKQHRNNGIGSYLLIRSMQYVYKLGFKTIRFLTQTSRKEAIALYEKLGFIQC